VKGLGPLVLGSGCVRGKIMEVFLFGLVRVSAPIDPELLDNNLRRRNVGTQPDVCSCRLSPRVLVQLLRFAMCKATAFGEFCHDPQR